MATDNYLTIPPLDASTIDRLFAKIEIDPVDPLEKCWIWTGGLRNGYGHFYYDGRREYTHRLIYAWLIAPLPRGRGRDIPVLDHVVCDCPSCCNPFHLRLASHKENLLAGNAPSAINARKTHCIHGHKLTGIASNGHRFCLVCRRIYDAKRRSSPESKRKRSAYNRERYRLNPEPAKARAREQRARLRDALKNDLA